MPKPVYGLDWREHKTPAELNFAEMIASMTWIRERPWPGAQNYRAENGRKGAARTARLRRFMRNTVGVRMHVGRTVMNDAYVPSIRLTGKWLAELGYEHGDAIHVRTNGKTIWITEAKP